MTGLNQPQKGAQSLRNYNPSMPSLLPLQDPYKLGQLCNLCVSNGRHLLHGTLCEEKVPRKQRLSAKSKTTDPREWRPPGSRGFRVSESFCRIPLGLLWVTSQERLQGVLSFAGARYTYWLLVGNEGIKFLHYMFPASITHPGSAGTRVLQLLAVQD